MKVYLIGASGAIGYSLFKFFRKNKINVTGTYFKNYKKGLVNFNLNKHSIFERFKNIKPDDIFILLAAKTDNKWILRNNELANKINVEKTIKLINDIKKTNSRIIYFSSAEVFDGLKGFYKESEVGNPVSRYGKTKNKIEKFLKNGTYSKYFILRTGANITMDLKYKCMIHQTYKTLMLRKPKMAIDNFFTITHEQDFNNGILKLINLRNNLKNNIFHISSNHNLNRVKFANLIKKYSNRLKNTKFDIVMFKDIKYGETRAAKNNLNSTNTRRILKIKFKNPENIIKQKLKLIEK